MNEFALSFEDLIKQTSESSPTRKISDTFAINIGKNVLRPIINLGRRKVNNMKMDLSGTEQVQKLKDRPYIVVANHLRPDCSRIEQLCAFSPDGIAIERAIKEQTAQQLILFAKCDQGWNAKGEQGRAFQKKTARFGQLAVAASGLIPLKKNPGSVNVDFVRMVDQAMKEDHPILLFPEGSWVEEFGQLPINRGAAYFSRKYNVPILPLWISRMNGFFDLNQEVRIKFGEAFQLNKNQSRAEDATQIRKAILDLRTER